MWKSYKKFVTSYVTVVLTKQKWLKNSYTVSVET